MASKLTITAPFEDLLEIINPPKERFDPIDEVMVHDGIRNFIYHGGRGSGKSHSIAAVLALASHKRKIRWLCAREIQKSLAASSKQLIEDKIVDLGIADDYDFTREGIVNNRNGSRFFFAGLKSNPDAVKSMEDLDGAWIEEADRTSEQSLELLTPTLRKFGARLIVSFNRRAVTDPVDARYLGGKPPPRTLVKQVNWRDNPFFPQALKEELEWLRGRDYDKYMHIWEGNPWQRSESKVFPSFEVMDMDMDIPEDCHPRFGADWGFSIDPTVLVKAYRFGRTLYISDEAYRVRCEIDDTPALFAGNCPINDPTNPYRWENHHNHTGVPDAYKWPIVADSARPETISYMARKGFQIQRAIKGAKSVEEGVEFIKSHNIVVHPRCTHTIDELSTYSYKIDKLTDKVLPVLADRDNHVIDALRYALEGDRRALRQMGVGGLGPLGIVGAGEIITGR